MHFRLMELSACGHAVYAESSYGPGQILSKKLESISIKTPAKYMYLLDKLHGKYLESHDIKPRALNLETA